MKRIILTSLMALLAFVCNAQDLITTKKGEDISAKVTKIGDKTVEYRSASNPDGPVYTIDKKDILLIRYANGEKDVFPDKSAATSSNGRVRYKDIKDDYNRKEYQPTPMDKYSRGWAGVASGVIPGLGQAIDGEWGRAAGFFFGNLGMNIVSASTLSYDSYTGSYDATGLTLAAFAAGIALNVWSIIDAVRVAQVKNMYLQDAISGRAAVSVDLQPYFAYEPHVGSGVPVSGLSFRLNF